MTVMLTDNCSDNYFCTRSTRLIEKCFETDVVVVALCVHENKRNVFRPPPKGILPQ